MKTGVLSILFALMAGAHAAPHLPADGSQVVESLPWRGDARARELRSLRTALAKAPKDLALATQVARRQIELGRQHGDPRYFGHAQAALRPWWGLADPPSPVRVLRASLLQSEHRFGPALADLDAVLKADPADAQAWLTRANILTVQARYPEARASCAQLARLASPLVAAACAAAAAPDASARTEALLAGLLQRESGLEPATGVWVATLLAELAARRGAAAEAHTHYRKALAVAPDDTYLLASCADFLLDQQRPDQAVTLLREHGRNDALLLRHAIAAARAGMTQQAAAARAELQARFAAAAMRGDRTHLREHARFALQVEGAPLTALRLAQENWTVQKEPADARVLLEAALATSRPESAAPVLAWLRASGMHDVQLERLARQLGSKT